MVTSDLRADGNMAVSCIRNASGYTYRISSFIVVLAMGQIPRSTERISSFKISLYILRSIRHILKIQISDVSSVLVSLLIVMMSLFKKSRFSV